MEKFIANGVYKIKSTIKGLFLFIFVGFVISSCETDSKSSSGLEEINIEIDYTNINKGSTGGNIYYHVLHNVDGQILAIDSLVNEGITILNYLKQSDETVHFSEIRADANATSIRIKTFENVSSFSWDYSRPDNTNFIEPVTLTFTNALEDFTNIETNGNSRTSLINGDRKIECKTETNPSDFLLNSPSKTGEFSRYLYLQNLVPGDYGVFDVNDLSISTKSIDVNFSHLPYGLTLFAGKKFGHRNFLQFRVPYDSSLNQSYFIPDVEFNNYKILTSFESQTGGVIVIIKVSDNLNININRPDLSYNIVDQHLLSNSEYDALETSYILNTPNTTVYCDYHLQAANSIELKKPNIQFVIDELGMDFKIEDLELRRNRIFNYPGLNGYEDHYKLFDHNINLFTGTKIPEIQIYSE